MSKELPIPSIEEFLKKELYITKDGTEDVHDSLMSVSDAVRKYTCFVLEQYREHAWKNGIALQDMMSWAQKNIK